MQYASSFFDPEDARSALPDLHAASLSSSSQSQAQSGGASAGSKRSQSFWASAFDEAEGGQCVRRRLWCRVMCPSQVDKPSQAKLSYPILCPLSPSPCRQYAYAIAIAIAIAYAYAACHVSFVMRCGVATPT
jgi:hypothetical protein